MIGLTPEQAEMVERHSRCPGCGQPGKMAEHDSTFGAVFQLRCINVWCNVQFFAMPKEILTERSR